jgi:alkanesulfonate monooxygenase
MPLRFHWSLSSAGAQWKGAKPRAAQSGIPNMAAHMAFCRHAEACGIESLLTAFGFHRPDPLVMATALGLMTEKISFMVACRSGVASPTAFVQQVNTVSALTHGRVCINVVAGHTPLEQGAYGDFLSHDERYQRTDEFLTICRAFWVGDAPVNFHGTYYHIEHGRLNTPFVAPCRTAPEIFLGGASPLALKLAAKHATCLLTLPDTPTKLGARIRPVLEQGTAVGLLVSLIARPTRAEALQAASTMCAAIGTHARRTHQEFAQRSDSVAFTSTIALAEKSSSEWLTPTLWTGAVPYLGAPAIALVGSFTEVAAAILEYRQVGVTQFLFMGWPDLEEMTFFSRGVLPLVRRQERQVGASSQEAGLQEVLAT